MNSDYNLVLRLKDKDEEAFNVLYERYFRLVKHVTLQIIPSDNIAEDIVQQTFIKMYNNIDSYKNDVSFSAWLCTIAKNLALNEMKKQSRLTQLPEYEVKDDSSSPSGEYQSKELIQQIKDLLGVKDYNLLMLRLYHGLSYKELSDMTGETIAALTNRYHRAVKKVKKLLKS